MLGVIVFDRTKKPVMVTEVGKDIVEQANVIVREMSRMTDVVNQVHGHVRGDFHLGVIPTLSPYLLPRFLSRFTTQYPEVNLFVSEQQTDIIAHRLQIGDLDAGLLATPLKHRAITERPLFYEPFVLYTSSEHPLYQKTAVSEKDLRYEDLWLLAEGHCLRTQVLNLCNMRLYQPENRRIHFDSGSLETLMRIIESGSGYTLIPYLAAEQIKDTQRKLMLKPFVGAPPLREISLVFNRTVLKHAIIDAIYNTITASVPKALIQTPTHIEQIVQISMITNQ
jgi:LysR family hydrogen peroxide-inducible transcriptional activator